MRDGLKRKLARLALCLSATLPFAQGAAAAEPLQSIGQGEAR